MLWKDFSLLQTSLGYLGANGVCPTCGSWRGLLALWGGWVWVEETPAERSECRGGVRGGGEVLKHQEVLELFCLGACTFIHIQMSCDWASEGDAARGLSPREDQS